MRVTPGTAIRAALATIDYDPEVEWIQGDYATVWVPEPTDQVIRAGSGVGYRRAQPVAMCLAGWLAREEGCVPVLASYNPGYAGSSVPLGARPTVRSTIMMDPDRHVVPIHRAGARALGLGFNRTDRTTASILFSPNNGRRDLEEMARQLDRTGRLMPDHWAVEAL